MFGIGKLRERISSLELELGVQKIKHIEHVMLSNKRHKKAMKLAGYEPIKELIKKNWDGKECHKPFRVVGEDGKVYDIGSVVNGGVLGYRVYIKDNIQEQYVYPALLQQLAPYGMENIYKTPKQFSDDEYFKEVGK